MTINERTRISLFAVAATLPVFTILTVWLAGVSFTANAAQKEVAELRMKSETDHETINNMNSNLKVIMYKMKISEEEIK